MTVSRHGTTCLRCCTSFVNSGGSTAAPKSWTPDQVRGDDDQQGSNRPLSVIALRILSGRRLHRLLEPRQPCARGGGVGADPAVVDVLNRHGLQMIHPLAPAAFRSEARRAGKECVSTCRFRWW